ncbi:MAG: glycerol kinase GlpK [Deltaproteobacteria bacterium]|nr:glycerol kinase GlpK [Deltaproteobacteria bacterium]
MTSQPLIAAIDQGTTGTTVLLLDGDENIVGRGYQEIPQSYPAPGQVEHDPEAIWQSVLAALSAARASLSQNHVIAAIGITNQRETVVLWDKSTGKPVAPALVWQDRRTTGACEERKQKGQEARIAALTGLLIDPYFSASKLQWLLDSDPELRARAEAGQLAFGTIDSFLVYRLSGEHITDASNAARTQLFNIHTGTWSDELCALFNIPKVVLPKVTPCFGTLARTRGVAGLDDGVVIAGMAGDQQAALFGQGCVSPGDAKCTFGTGSFLLMNVGDAAVVSHNRLLTTVAWTTADSHTTYALEGGAFVCGALVQWLRDGLQIIKHAADIETLAASVLDSGGVTIVPAFTGLGAPHWRPDARGMISGLTRGAGQGHLARATLEAMAFQNVDIVKAMESDAGCRLNVLRVDGGATANNLLMQIQADLLGAPIERPSMVETTALGAARLAAVGAGLRPWPGLPAGASATRVTRFEPKMSDADRNRAYDRWKNEVKRAAWV